MTRHRVLLVEDDARTRAHLARAIEGDETLRLEAACPDCASARAELAKATPDVLLTDLGLPDGNGIELIRELRARQPDAQIMVITVSGDERTVVRAIEAGARGYLLKQGTSEEIVTGIRQLLDGGSPISAPIARYLLRRFQQEPATPAPQSEPNEPAPTLTERETEILQLIAKGFNSPEIARLLEISAHTVTTHVRHIYSKLEVSSRGAAVYEALQLGLIQNGG